VTPLRPHRSRVACVLLACGLLFASALLSPGTSRLAGAAESLQSLVNDYIASIGPRDEAGYAAQTLALERIADLKTKAAQAQLRELLTTYGPADHRRAILLLRATIRNGNARDVDAAIRWIERRKEPLLIDLIHEVVGAARLPETRAYIRGDALRKATPRVKVQLIRGIGLSGDGSAIPALLKILREEDRDVRVETIEALGRLKAVKAISLIQVFLRDELFEMRDAAARALGWLGSPRAIPALLRALADDEPLVVESAAQSLGQIGDPAAIPALIDGLEKYRETNLRLLDAFAEALHAISGRAIAPDPELWRAWWAAMKDKPFERAAEPAGSTTIEGPNYYGFPVRSSRVVFVLDVSRSMGWNDRLKTAKEEIVQVLERLPRSTHFNLIIFSDEAVLWKGSPGLKEASPGLVREAIRYVNGRRPIRGTNTYDALMKALDAPRADTIFFLSDGHPSAGTVDDPKLILNEVRRRNQYRRVRIHAIALMRGEPPAAFASLENAERSQAFMECLAGQNNGRFKLIR
jgi:HEAT repeat protein